MVRVDKESAVVVLFALALGGSLGLQPPVHFSGVWQAFVDVALLTGYFYIVRSTFRLIWEIIEYKGSNYTVTALTLLSISFLGEYYDTRYSAKFVRGILNERLIMASSAIIACIPRIHKLVTALGYVGIVSLIIAIVWFATYIDDGSVL